MSFVALLLSQLLSATISPRYVDADSNRVYATAGSDLVVFDRAGGVRRVSIPAQAINYLAPSPSGRYVAVGAPPAWSSCMPDPDEVGRIFLVDLERGEVRWVREQFFILSMSPLGPTSWRGDRALTLVYSEAWRRRTIEVVDPKSGERVSARTQRVRY
jgi:hypothetical protein